MTKQEAYERIRAWFVADQRFGYHDDKCLYLGPEGQRCAVGCLIPDDSPFTTSNKVVTALPREDRAEFERIFGEGSSHDFSFMNFLNQAQARHDDEAGSEGTVAGFIVRLDNLAEREGLQVVSA